MTVQLRIYFDTDTLLSLACAKPAMAAVTSWFGDRCHVTTRVLDEVKRKRQQGFPNSGIAYGAAMHMTPVEPSDLGVDVMDRMAFYRERLAGSGDHSREHLGEASCVAVAVETGGLVASDDQGTRLLAADTDVKVVRTHQLLTKMVSEGVMSCADANAARDSMKRGRHYGVDYQAQLC